MSFLQEFFALGEKVVCTVNWGFGGDGLRARPQFKMLPARLCLPPPVPACFGHPWGAASGGGSPKAPDRAWKRKSPLSGVILAVSKDPDSVSASETDPQQQLGALGSCPTRKRVPGQAASRRCRTAARNACTGRILLQVEFLKKTLQRGICFLPKKSFLGG